MRSRRRDFRDYPKDRWLGRKEDGRLLLLQVLLGVGIGAITFRAPGITAAGLLLYMAAWSLATGVIEIAAAIRLRKAIQGERQLALSGIAPILFAVFLMWLPSMRTPWPFSCGKGEVGRRPFGCYED